MRRRNDDHSVPVAHAHREVMVKGHVDEVVIAAGVQEIARHRRSRETADFVLDPPHSLALPERKVGALDQAAPLQGWDLPDELAILRRLLESRLSRDDRCAAGRREFVQVLRLVETFPIEVVHAAVKDALRLGAVGCDALEHLALCRVERRPARLDAERHPHLPVAHVGTTSRASYEVLMPGASL